MEDTSQEPGDLGWTCSPVTRSVLRHEPRVPQQACGVTFHAGVDRSASNPARSSDTQTVRAVGVTTGSRSKFRGSGATSLNFGAGLP